MSMTSVVYLAAGDAATRKGAVALGISELLVRRPGRLGIFRPVVLPGRADGLIETIKARFGLEHSATGVTYEAVHQDPERAIAEIEARYRVLAGQCDAVVIVGTDYTDVGAPTEFAFNAIVAARLGAPVLLVVNGLGRTAEQIASAVEMCRRELRREHAVELGTVVTRADPRHMPAGRARLRRPDAEPPVFLMPEEPRLAAPTISDLMSACQGHLLLGDERQLNREVSGLMIGAMSLPNILERLTEGVCVIMPADRAAGLLPGLIAAHGATTFPALSGVILSGGMELPDPVARLFDGLVVHLPVIITEDDTFDTAVRLSAVEGRFSPSATGKNDLALRLFASHVDGEELLRRVS
jgi:phosphate acetyltransferase